MASGNTLRNFGALDNEPALSNPAIPVKRNGHWGISFDQSTDQFGVFSDVLPSNYAGGGLTAILHWTCFGAVSGNVMWFAEIERVGVAQDIDSDSFATGIAAAASAVPATDGILKTTSIAFTSGAQMDSLVVGERYRLRISRDANHASDTAAAPTEIWNVEVKET